MSPKQRIPMPQTAPAIPAAAVYVRVSTEEQATSGWGLAIQRERCIAMATVKGWQVDDRHLFADEGISGTKDVSGRPALAALLQAVDAGDVDAVIVLALDRLGRKTNIILDLVERMTGAGAEVVSCKESLDTTTPTGRFVLGIFAGLAQLERDTIVERTTSGRNARGKRDGERGGRVPYGYMRTSGGVCIDEPAAEVVRTIDRLRRRRLSFAAIAADLTAQLLPTPQGGATWYPGSVRIIAKNRALYRGGKRGGSDERWPTIL